MRSDGAALVHHGACYKDINDFKALYIFENIEVEENYKIFDFKKSIGEDGVGVAFTTVCFTNASYNERTYQF